MKRLETKFLLALLLPFTLILGGGIWGGTAQHTHRSADQGGVISWIPTGFIGCYAGTTPPTNTLETYGQLVSRVTYPNLFSQIGTTYGAGDGVTTFGLPDTRGRVMVSLDNLGGSSANRITAAAADTLGGSGGTEIMSIAQMPSHNHPSTQYTNTVGAGANYRTYGTAANTLATDPITNAAESEGGGQPFNPPFLALKCVIGT
ncbi:MAG: tail fiber protein [Nitrospirota bacterium]|nr:tail fiber protein [Nitrospirota bacterium]